MHISWFYCSGICSKIIKFYYEVLKNAGIKYTIVEKCNNRNWREKINRKKRIFFWQTLIQKVVHIWTNDKNKNSYYFKSWKYFQKLVPQSDCVISQQLLKTTKSRMLKNTRSHICTRTHSYETCNMCQQQNGKPRTLWLIRVNNCGPKSVSVNKFHCCNIFPNCRCCCAVK